MAVFKLVKQIASLTSFSTSHVIRLSIRNDSKGLRHCEDEVRRRSNLFPYSILVFCNTLKRVGYVYILTNKNNTTLYTGVTADLIKRVEEHKLKIQPKSFSARYNLNKLVYFEWYAHIEEAITREKQLKAGSRQSKLNLIITRNPHWEDLYPKIVSGEIEL